MSGRQVLKLENVLLLMDDQCPFSQHLAVLGKNIDNLTNSEQVEEEGC